MTLRFLLSAFLLVAQSGQPATTAPLFPGKLVNVGGHKMHFHCDGSGSPTVVIEYGLGDVSTDWSRVQAAASKFTRVCSYDRAGYAWSEPGPLPRTYAQLNLELHEGLNQLGEMGPFVLVGHSFGGPVVRSFSARYPDQVAGMVLVDTIQEDQRIPIMGKAVRVRDTATGKKIPQPRLQVRPDDITTRPDNPAPEPLEPPYKHLSPENQRIHLWASSLFAGAFAESSQLEWSPESLALMHTIPQKGILKDRPLIVLARARGGYDDSLGVPASTLEAERLACQKLLAELSTNSALRIIDSGHNMQLEAPSDVAVAIHDVVIAVQRNSHL